MKADTRITKTEWIAKSRDLRTWIDGTPYLVTLDRETGATVLGPVTFVPEKGDE